MAANENENDAPQVYLLGKTYLGNDQGQFFIRNDPIVHMSAGDRHSIVVTKSGRAFAFGDNSSGQLGLGHTNDVDAVSCIKSLKFGDSGEIVILSACGRESSLVATNRGSLYGFGSNNRCQLGFESSESTTTYSQPIKIEHYIKGKINWKQIAMGAEHACALSDDGQVYIWGSNKDGQCGQPRKQETISKPRELPSPSDLRINEIACGYYHTALVSEDGRLFVFGNNDDRQLGCSTSEKFAGPEEVSLPDKVKAVACGNEHTVILTAKGDVYACGHGDRGQLGLGFRVLSGETFEHVQTLPKRVTAIAAGEGHTAVLSTRNEMYVFGDGKHGKLGSSTHSNEFEPCIVDKFKKYNVLKVVCGGCQTIVLAQKKDNTLEHSGKLDTVQKTNEQKYSDQLHNVQKSNAQKHNGSLYSVPKSNEQKSYGQNKLSKGLTSNMSPNTVDGRRKIHRFSDVAAEPRRMLLPIQGFEEKPLVSLEEAVIPLTSLVSDVEQMVWIVKQNCSRPKDDLTSDESASIMLYTMEWQPYEKSFYVILNAALRAANRDQLKPWFSYLRLVLNALQKLPSTHHVLYRGVKLDLTAEYCRGNTVVWWGFSSCTVSIETLNNEQFLGKSGVRTLFSIECNAGKNIRSHSFYPSEDEVLLLPARQFEVLGCLDQGNGLNIIQLRETQPKFPLIKFPSS